MSSVVLKTITFLFLFLSLPSKFHCSNSQPWIQAGYWDSASALPVSQINSALFSHLLCAFAIVNSSNHHLSINSANQESFAAFANTVKIKNPSVLTLLSIWVGPNNSFNFASMIDQSSHRQSFIESSIRTARLYGFQGLDLCRIAPGMGINSTNLGSLFGELRTAVVSESKISGKSRLLLAATVTAYDSTTYPIDSMMKNLDWVHVVAYDYYVPTKDNFTGAHAALYGAFGWANSDDRIRKWLTNGLLANKLVLGLAYHGYAWTLVNPNDNAIGAPATGPAMTIDGSMGYKIIKSFIQNYGYGAISSYNFTYVLNLWSSGSIWINFDDVEAIREKVSYAREKGLLGYSGFQLANDDNWVLSRAAAQVEDEDRRNKLRLLLIVLVVVFVFVLTVGSILCCLQRRVLMFKGISDSVRKLLSKLKVKAPGAENLSDSQNLKVFSFTEIKAATCNFLSENKLGEGGFGPVYKGKLAKGQEIAVKRLSRTSQQGLEEFENEVTLTARLQHVNLVRVLGFCVQREEKMLVYEYMPNKSLDFHLFDSVRRYLLDWEKRAHIIEGVAQGLVYLQEYSNFTIIHRDLKASNILLDINMNPKISDFGMARLFRKDECEANTSRIVGTYGYVPPEYVRRGIYSVKYDVYSFGVVLLQIISGKRTTSYYGSYQNLNLLEYAYELMREGKGTEFFDESLDDSRSSCKLMTCMQVGLLCVQENAEDRPSMLEVSYMLKNGNMNLATPKKPAFSVKGEEGHEKSLCSTRVKICSVDDATLTQLVPR